MTKPLPTLLKIVSGSDLGGVKTVEIAFIRVLQTRGVRVIGVIIGKGPTTQQYSQVFDKSIIIFDPLPNFGNRFSRILNLIKSEIKTHSAWIHFKNQISGTLHESNILAVGVTRPYYLKFAGLIARTLTCRAYWHMPNSVNNPFMALYYRYLLSAYPIIPVGNSFFSLRSIGINGGHVVYPGFHTTRIANNRNDKDIRNNNNIPNDTIVFGFAARIIYDKAPDIVLKAFLKSEPFRNGAHLIFAGGPLDNEIGQYLQDQSKRCGNGQIHFVGHLEDIVKFFSSINVFINGRRRAEPFGISIAEALASGIPVISYKLGGPSEMIEHGINGWLVQSPTSDAYQKAINEAWYRRDSWLKMGQEAIHRTKYLNVENQVVNYMKILGLN